MTKRQLHGLIALTGIKPIGYIVRVSGFDGQADIPVASVRVGNAIVRALRAEALARPDLFPCTAGYVCGDGARFATIEDATTHANGVHKRTGAIIAIERANHDR